MIGNAVVCGDCVRVMEGLPDGCVDLSFWSPPYHVGKGYERGQSLDGWKGMLSEAIAAHGRLLAPGRFMVVDIADILCFPDPSIPRFQAELGDRKRHAITREDVLAARTAHPGMNRRELAAVCGCSEQTIQRRLEGNNVRGGKQAAMTKVLPTVPMICGFAEDAGLILYDRRIWRKDPAWRNSRWHSVSYRSVDEFEHLCIFWKPGPTVVRRGRLSREEWAEWGSRGVWDIPSVRRNSRHEAEFPEMLAERVIRLLSDPGDLVLDPFAGSGTTPACAKRLGRRWLGIEKEEKYARMAEERVAMEKGMEEK